MEVLVGDSVMRLAPFFGMGIEVFLWEPLTLDSYLRLHTIEVVLVLRLCWGMRLPLQHPFLGLLCWQLVEGLMALRLR